jgi:outer membrane protein assembly factor BamE (lipoprotein component of BamABCDE complex)
MKRALLWMLSTLLLLAIAVMAAGAWCMQAPAIAYSKMQQMRVGMTENEVTVLLGTPGSRFWESSGLERWAYSRHTWATFNVWIGPDRTVVKFEHDF